MTISPKILRQTKIDWLSFSFHTGTYDRIDMDNIKEIEEHLYSDSVIALDLLYVDTPVIGKGRRPYNTSVSNKYCTLWFSEKMDWSLFEVNGLGCAYLASESLLLSLIHRVQKRVSRIDFATDLLVGSAPMVKQFVDAGYSDAFKTTSHIVSSSGESYYIGSRKSERMCRIYQYSPPHERSSNLRIEVELKGKMAKKYSNQLFSYNIIEVSDNLMSDYEFGSKMLTLSDTSGMIFDTISGKQRVNGSLMWFYKQVVPCFVRLCEDGTISDPRLWLDETFIKALRDGEFEEPPF